MTRHDGLKALAAAALAGAVAVCGTVAHAEEKAAGTVVATVNGKVITEEDLALAEGEVGNDLGSYSGMQRKRILVEYLIENQLFAAAAEGDKLGSGPDFEKRMAYWRQRTLRDLFFDKSVKGSISDAVAKGIYDDKIKMLKPEEEVSARHILVDSEARAKELIEKINAGADFAALAKENSGDAGSKADGGNLGYFGRGQMVPEFEAAAFALGKGEVSKPVKSNFGWHVIKVEDKRQKQPPPFEEVKDRIVGSMVQSKAQEIATQLRAKSKIEYVDAGVKKQVEEDEKRAAEQRKALDQQMQQQIEKLEAPEQK